jgi:hypothetical protein
MAVPLGPTTTTQAVNQINSMSTRGVPTAAPLDIPRDPMVWVPDRVVPVPGEGTVMVPGHWERRLEGRDVHVPSLTVRNPATGEIKTAPAAILPPSDERVGP